MTFEFQAIIPIPPPAPLASLSPFAALGVCADNGKILSVDYLPHDLRVTKVPALDGQTKKVVGDLAERLDAFLKDPKSVDFEGVPLCYSALREEHCKVRLPTEERRKVLEKLGESDIIPREKVQTYGDIGKVVLWDNKKAVKKAVDAAHRGQDIYDHFAKAVGDICPANPFGIVIPCFRVVLSGPCLGELGCNPYLEDEEEKKDEEGKSGWELGREIKRWLLEREGWEVDAPKGSIPPPYARLSRAG